MDDKWITPIVLVGIAAVGGLCYLNRWMGKKDEFAKNVGETLETIQKDIKSIFRILYENKTIQSSSPLRLTELGQSISDTLEAAAWAKRTAKEIAPKITDRQPYVIQNYCFEFVRESDALSDELTQKIQEAAYNNGIEVARVTDVLAIELRDALLKIYGLKPPPSD